MSWIRRALLSGAAGIVAGVVLTASQAAETGTLSGNVVDPSCAVLPGVTVTARQLDNDLTRSTTTDFKGTFGLSALPAGAYKLTATLPGFRAAMRTGIDLRPGATVSSSLAMELGPNLIVDSVANPGPSRPMTIAAPVRRSCVPVEMSRNVMMLHATLNDVSDPVWLILDTGASVSVVAEALATARGMPTQSIGETRGGIGEAATRVGMIGRVTFHVAGTDVVTTNTVSLPLGEDFDVIGHQVDGILGSDAFLKYVVRLDYAAASVTFFDANSFVYDGTGATIPITLSANTPNIDVAVDAGGTSLGVNALFDTGSDGAIGLTRPFVDKHHLLDGRTTVAGFGVGVGGQAAIVIGRLEAVRLGPFAFAQPVVGFSRATQGATASEARDAILGAEILRRFIVTIDYPHKRVILEPNARLGDPFDFDMSGLVLAKNPRGTVHVLAVRADSPAAQLDVRPGDEVASINGRAADALPLDTILRWLRIPDREYRLGLRRAGQTVDLTLRTKRLI